MHIFEHDDGTVTATCSRRSGVVTSVTFTPDTAERVTAAAECLPGDPEEREDDLYLALSRVCRAPAAYVAAQQRVADLLDEMNDEVNPAEVELSSLGDFTWRQWWFHGAGTRRLLRLLFSDVVTLGQLVEEAHRTGVKLTYSDVLDDVDVYRVARLGDYYAGPPHWADRAVTAYVENALVVGCGNLAADAPILARKTA
ncbi:hypothetical protein HMPREF3130_08275 [Corynebacterium sp. HMSC14B06]|uniref:hypothetical protein n=1 Tax=Corynebacterium sp. HMSC14B06 TaxID=1581098 RepID=UPI0008A3FBC4|nr:hypothetical protein [Corynebacterium sp. HMSC14B06]OFT69487.1 hypothetical protein HMPREF3130_08275 [Corynebacterium sp. HMSC14B06]